LGVLGKALPEGVRARVDFGAPPGASELCQRDVGLASRVSLSAGPGWAGYAPRRRVSSMDLFCDAQETMQRYEGHVRELRRLFVFHGLSCGEPESFGALGAKLAESRAFRTDVSALARGVRDQEKGAMSAEEMLTVVALAVGGEDLVEGRSPALGVRHAVGVLWVLLDAIGGWRETDGGGRSPGVPAVGDEGEAGAGRRSRGVGELWMEAGFGAAEAPEARLERMPEARGGLEGTPAALPTGVLSGSGERVELAIRELKVYLDDIDRRMCRLEPHVEGLSATVQASEERLERLRRDRAASEAVEREGARAEVAAGGAVTPEWSGNGAGSASGHGSGNGAGALTLSPNGRARAEVREGEGVRAPDAVGLGYFSRGMEEASKEEGRRESPAEKELERERAVPDGGWSGGVETTGRAEMEKENRGPVDWRRRIGIGLGAVAVLFAMVGLGGLMHMQRTSTPPATRGDDAAVRGAGDGAVGPVVTGGATEEARLPERQPVVPQPLVGPGAPERDGAVAKGGGAGMGTAAAPASVGVSATPSGAVAGKKMADAAVKAPKVVSRREERAGNEAATRSSVSAGAGVVRGARVVQGHGAGVAAGRGEVAAKTSVSPRVPPAPPVRVAEASRGDRGTGGTGGGAVAAGERPVVEVRSAGGKVVTARRPVYPAEALRAHTEATVVLHAFLTKDGTVRRMDVVKGAYGFNRSAMDAVWGWRYKPMVVHGQPVETETQITVDYRLH
jgi:TonB family protein